MNTRCLVALAALAGFATVTLADPHVVIDGESKSWEAETMQFVHHLHLKNTGDMAAVGYRVTSQPYTKRKNPPHMDAAEKQEKKDIMIPAGGTKDIDFIWQGEDQKDWMWK